MIGAIIAAGSLLLQAGSAVASHKDKARSKRANDAAARDALTVTSAQIATRQEEEAIAAAQQVHQLTRQTMYGAGSLTANAAASNVEGATVSALEADLFRSEFENRDVLTRNLASTMRQLDQQRSAARADAVSRINGVQGPSALATGLSIGASLTAFGYDWMRIKAPAGGATPQP